MSQTAQYLAIRDALISCRERFRIMQIEFNEFDPGYGAWAYHQALDGFKEVDAILSNPDNQE